MRIRINRFLKLSIRNERDRSIRFISKIVQTNISIVVTALRIVFLRNFTHFPN